MDLIVLAVKYLHNSLLLQVLITPKLDGTDHHRGEHFCTASNSDCNSVRPKESDAHMSLKRASHLCLNIPSQKIINRIGIMVCLTVFTVEKKALSQARKPSSPVKVAAPTTGSGISVRGGACSHVI